ncbi:hypothetical protein FRC12_004708 [Ceratobasidium sp. 428]|nr:hypothetical protein FRC12_004708 [Ceratobasidium sp. 428]
MSLSTYSSSSYAVETVFAVPELFLLIQSFLDRADNVALLSLSRQAFARAAPVVWESVELKQLLQLITGVQMAPPRSVLSSVHSIVQQYCTVTFPKSVELTRFRLYSSFVKVLRADGLYSIDYSDNLPTPLLPNLQRLVLHVHGSAEAKYIDWVSRLLTPSLKELKLLSVDQQHTSEPHGFLDLAWLDLDTYLSLVDKVSASCPQIQALRIFGAGQGQKGLGWTDLWRNWITARHSQQMIDSVNSMSNHFHAFYPNYISFDKLAGLHHLRSLSITIPYIGQAMLQNLGQLPRLDNLSLHINIPMLQPLDHTPITLPANSFPSLRHLALYRPHPSVFELFLQPCSLFRNLLTARIHIESSQGDDRVTLRRLPSNAVVQCFSQSSSALTNLTISSDAERNCFTLFWPTINIFSHMPLKRLDLGSIQFNPVPIAFAVEANGMQANLPHIQWKDFLAAVPLLEALVLSRQNVAVQDLQTILHMLPKLRSLVLCSIQLDEVFGAQSLPDERIVGEPITICAGFKALFKTDDAYIDQLAKHLHTLRTGIAFEAGKVQMPCGQHWVNPSFVEKLNSVVKFLTSEGGTDRACNIK